MTDLTRLSAAQRIDRLCDEFEAAWASGKRPRIETLLTEAPETERDELLVSLVKLEWELRRRAGETPEIDEYRQRFPGHATWLNVTTDWTGGGSSGSGAASEVARRPNIAWSDPAAWPKFEGYEILEFLGQGGMGVVFRARQLSLDRQIAIKMLRGAEFATAEQQSDFHREALSLARLRHPAIVSIHEVGQHARGPYMALEYVAGGSLAARLRGNPWPARDAAEMVLRIAEGVGYAHQLGIIHRDLNPANILLEGAGTPKIADFGLARWIHPDASVSLGRLAGTPCYMAPEQASGSETVRTTTDIYGVGAILYELLTGRPPFQGTTPLEILELVRHQDPVPPRRLQPTTPLDLESICTKCLSKEPELRYQSAAELAADLRRFLQGDPVLARPASSWTYVRRWARRNPLSATLVSLVIASICLGLLGTMTQLFRAERHLADARRQRELYERNFLRARNLADELTRISATDMAAVPQLLPARRRVLETAEIYYRQAVAERRQQPELQHDLGLTLFRLADIQAQLGNQSDAVTAYREGIVIERELLRQSPGDPRARRNLAGGLQNLAGLLRYHGPQQLDEAIRLQKEAGEVWEGLAEAADPQFDARLEWAKAVHSLGVLLEQRGDSAAALAQWQRVDSILERETSPGMSSAEARRIRARALSQRGNLLETEGKYSESRAAHERAVEICRENVLESSDRKPEFDEELADCLNNLAITLKRQDQRSEAEGAYREAWELLDKLRRQQSHRGDIAASFSRTAYNLGLQIGEDGRFAESRKLLSDSLEVQRALAIQSPQDEELRGGVGRRIGILYQVQLAQEDYAAALETIRLRQAIWANDWRQELRAATEVAQCLAERRKHADAAGEGGTSDSISNQFVDEAVRLLRAARRHGWQPDAHWFDEPQWAPLKTESRFREMLDEWSH